MPLSPGKAPEYITSSKCQVCLVPAGLLKCWTVWRGIGVVPDTGDVWSSGSADPEGVNREGAPKAHSAFGNSRCCLSLIHTGCDLVAVGRGSQ